MPRTEYSDVGTGNSYAMPIASVDPYDATDAVTGVPVGTSGVHAFDGLDDTYHLVYVRAGVSPVSSDLVIGDISALGNVPSSGSGARRVVISVVDYSAAAVVGAKVTIQTAAGATIAGRFGNTIAGGLVIFNLDDGDYKGLVTTSSGYDAHTAEAFTVDQDDEPVTLTITANTTAAPDDPSLCRLTVGFVSVHGLPIVGATVTPSLSIPPELVPSGYALNESDVETTDSSGGFTADFIQGITVQLNVDHEGKSYRVQIKIPALQTYAVKLTV